MKTPPRQVLICNAPRGPVRHGHRQSVVTTETVFQTPVRRQRVINNINYISPPKGKRRVNRRLIFN